MLGRWVNRTIISSTKRLMFQVLFLSSPIECVAFERLELLKTQITLAEMDHFFLCHFGVTSIEVP